MDPDPAPPAAPRLHQRSLQGLQALRPDTLRTRAEAQAEQQRVRRGYRHPRANPEMVHEEATQERLSFDPLRPNGPLVPSRRRRNEDGNGNA
jgi:hypothetical protein